jgi:uncharacterized protein (TIGR03086 family)
LSLTAPFPDHLVMTEPDRTRTVTTLIEAGLDRAAALQGTFDRTGGPMDPLTQLGQVGPLLAGVVGNLTADDLDRPTPCTDYTVRGVLEHMIGGATLFAAAYRQEAPSEPDLSDVLAGFAPALENLFGAVTAPGALDKTIAAPFGEVSGEAFARYIALDGLVHGWDLATATGQPYNPPDDLVAEIEAYARQAVDPLRDGQAFSEAVEPASDASPIERLAAYTGRRPVS